MNENKTYGNGETDMDCMHFLVYSGLTQITNV